MSRPRLLTLDSRTQGVQAWALELGISTSALLDRLRRGWPLEKALSTPGTPRPRDERERLARGHGLSRNLLEVRLAKGWPLEKALSTPAKAHAA